MVAHSDRDHATWSASSTEANWHCSGRLSLTMDLPETTSEAADWGTCCHQISERCLWDDGDADRFIGSTEKAKKFSFEVDEEMADTAQMYVGYVRSKAPRGLVADGDVQLFIEQKFSLAAIKPPFEAGGTADAVVYNPGQKNLEVIDLKGGRGVVVDAKGNKQLRTYALGAMLANKGLDVETVTVTIVQPRAGHKDGRIRSETFHVVDLLEWTTDLLAAMHRSYTALQDRKAIGTSVVEGWWNTTYLAAGDHCKFCKAAGSCPALEQRATDAAGVWFDDLDQPTITNTPDRMDPAELSARLDMLDMISDWINAVRAYAHTQAEMGVEIPGYILVPKEGREKWVDDVAAAKAVQTALTAGVDEEKVLNAPKPKTPKQVRDALKKAKLGEVIAKLEGLSSVKTEGTNLVASAKTTRSAVTPKAQQFFSALD